MADETMTAVETTEGAAPPPIPGSIAWHDLTVGDAEAVRDFYAAVVGWKWEPLNCGGYDDFVLSAPDTAGGEPDPEKEMVGICHARGANAALPPQWLMYIHVADLGLSVAACIDKGGEVLSGPRDYMAGLKFCVIRDPAGAVCALMGPMNG